MSKRVVVFSLLGLASIAIASAASTQYLARQLRYHRHLGAPVTTMGGTPVYRPWAWLEWDDRFHRYAPRVFETASLVTYGALACVLVPSLALAFVSRRGARGSTSHGSARWGTTEELRAAGMLGSEGVVLSGVVDQLRKLVEAGRARDALTVPGVRRCPAPHCAGALRKRQGSHGEFWSCTRYPACSFTEDLSDPRLGSRRRRPSRVDTRVNPKRPGPSS